MIPEAVDLWIPVTGIGSGVRGEAIADCAGIVQCFRGDLIWNMRLLSKGTCNDVSYYIRRMCLLEALTYHFDFDSFVQFFPIASSFISPLLSLNNNCECAIRAFPHLRPS